jgi:serine/threonine protein phosphatase PrpC
MLRRVLISLALLLLPLVMPGTARNASSLPEPSALSHKTVAMPVGAFCSIDPFKPERADSSALRWDRIAADALASPRSPTPEEEATRQELARLRQLVVRVQGVQQRMEKQLEHLAQSADRAAAQERRERERLLQSQAIDRQEQAAATEALARQCQVLAASLQELRKENGEQQKWLKEAIAAQAKREAESRQLATALERNTLRNTAAQRHDAQRTNDRLEQLADTTRSALRAASRGESAVEDLQRQLVRLTDQHRRQHQRLLLAGVGIIIGMVVLALAPYRAREAQPSAPEAQGPQGTRPGSNNGRPSTNGQPALANGRVAMERNGDVPRPRASAKGSESLKPQSPKSPAPQPPAPKPIVPSPADLHVPTPKQALARLADIAEKARKTLKPAAGGSSWNLGLSSIAGPVRSENQDYALAFSLNDLQVLIIADGCGGHAYGQRAAYVAARAAAEAAIEMPGKIWRKNKPIDIAKSAMQSAEQQLAAEAQRLGLAPDADALRTTLIVVVGNQKQYGLAHIGDGGGYIVRESGQIEQFLEPQKADGQSPNILAASLGPQIQGEPVMHAIARMPGDVLLAGTDGVFDRIAGRPFAMDVLKAALALRGDLLDVAQRVVADLAACRDEEGFICEDNLTLGLMARGAPRIARHRWSAPQGGKPAVDESVVEALGI